MSESTRSLFYKGDLVVASDFTVPKSKDFREILKNDKIDLTFFDKGTLEYLSKESTPWIKSLSYEGPSTVLETHPFKKLTVDKISKKILKSSRGSICKMLHHKSGTVYIALDTDIKLIDMGEGTPNMDERFAALCRQISKMSADLMTVFGSTECVIKDTAQSFIDLKENLKKIDFQDHLKTDKILNEIENL